VHHDASVPFPARYSSAASVPSSRRSLAGGVRAWALAGALAGVCAGCVDYQAAPLDPARRVDQFAARRLTDPALQRELEPLLPQALADWPPHEWDRAQLLAVALVQNPEIAVARAEARAVSAGEITAAQPPNPDLILQSEYAIHDTHPWLYGIAFDWPLRSHERRRLEVDLARLETGRANLRLLDAAWGVRRALIGALSEAQGARRRLLLLTQVGELQDRLVALERRRIAAGEDPATELVNSQRARIEIEQQRAQQLVLANAAQAAAARALGVPPQALDDINLGWPDWGDPPPIDAEALRASRERALLSRADLRGAIGEYAAAETRLHLAVARQYPQFSLGPGYYWDHGIAKFPFDVGFTLPFNGNRGEIAEARAGRELAAQRMLALQADIYGEIAAAERAERLARLNIDAAQRQLQAAQQQSRQAQIGQRVGAIGAAEAAAANLLVLRAQLELLEMRTQLQESRDGLEDVMRTPLSGPELGLAQFAGGVSSGGGT
jgi:outer membrane protein TolC